MSYLVLARKWRPKTFAEMVGQEHVLRALVNALEQQRLHHAYLFSGTRGVGKTTVARILAKALNCEQGITAQPCGECSACREIDDGRFVDLLEVDAASRTKVDDTRELLDNVQYAPTRGRFKVYLVDEVHMLSTHSFNALLKTLEEPPPHVKFLLATTDPQKLPVTVLSRCLKFNLKRLPVELIEKRLEQITETEDVAAEASGLRLLAKAADGSMRDGLSLLDQAIAFGGGAVKESEVRLMLGSVEQRRILRLLDRLSAGDAAGLLAAARELAEEVPDYDAALADMASALQRIALELLVPGSGQLEDEQELAALVGRFKPEDVQLYYQIAVNGRRDLRLAPDPQSGFEMCLIRMLAFRPADADAVAARGPQQGGQRAEAQSVTPTRRKKAAQGKVTETGSAAEWPAIIERAGLTGAARQLAANCVMLGRTEETIDLRLDPASESMLTRQLEEKLKQQLSEYFATDISLRISVDRLPEETPAQQQTRQQQERLRAARATLEEDPNVKALREAFDATIQDDTVRPLN